MRYRWIAVGAVLFGMGCNRQDAECLGRIGSLVGHRLEKLKPNAGGDKRVTLSLPGYDAPAAAGGSEAPSK
jgi:hypothetical protein